jgi:hypothetical protein
LCYIGREGQKKVEEKVGKDKELEREGFVPKVK